MKGNHVQGLAAGPVRWAPHVITLEVRDVK